MDCAFSSASILFYTSSIVFGVHVELVHRIQAFTEQYVSFTIKKLSEQLGRAPNKIFELYSRFEKKLFNSYVLCFWNYDHNVWDGVEVFFLMGCIHNQIYASRIKLHQFILLKNKDRLCCTRITFFIPVLDCSIVVHVLPWKQFRLSKVCCVT